jgi:hypothetical protein
VDQSFGFGARDVSLACWMTVIWYRCQCLLLTVRNLRVEREVVVFGGWELTSVLVPDASLNDHTVRLAVFGDAEAIVLFLQSFKIQLRRLLLLDFSGHRLCTTHVCVLKLRNCL